ncbi:MAG: 50S ribosome-binding GTPase [Actinomycetota bacterium]|nr:50S ribosome-binding GTPase [Actinomycetota bacterium]
MSALVEGVRRALGRGADVTSRVDGLQRAVEAAQGRLPDEIVEPARHVLEHAGQRLRLSADHTVVAIAGATGSGKSSLFNALCGLDLAAVGVKRPTTSWALSCAWGPEGAGELLDWVGIPRRHQVARGSLLDSSDADQELQGLVLLDLPDHDSTEVSHHVEVDRLVQMADLLVWVLDPQKYADAAVHDRYLKPLSTHADVMLILVNHIDEVPDHERESLLADVRRLLEQDGLSDVPALVTSATTGEGVQQLRAHLVRRVSDKQASRDRLLADVEQAVARLSSATGHAQPGDVARAEKAALVDAFASAAGVPVVVDAVRRSTRVRARQATGWPPTRWLTRLRPDPLRRLHLNLGSGESGAVSTARTSLPQPTEVQRARVDTTVRTVVTDATAPLPHLWAAAVRQASVSRLDDTGDALDAAVGQTELGVDRRPLWWTGVKWLQWALFAVTVLGALWLAGLFALGYLALPEPDTPDWRGVPVPTVMFLGGALAGLVLALLSRLLAALSARRRAAAVERRLRNAIAEVVQDYVVDPIQTEIEAYRACRDGIEAARRR